jgi:hypothetical protein
LKRVSAILLLTLFSLTLISPALFGDTESNLPACCRRDGKHHCALASMANLRLSAVSGPAFQSGEICPYLPGLFLGKSTLDPFVAAISLAIVSLLVYSAAAWSDSKQFVHAMRIRSHQKRGPPCSPCFA